MVDRERRSPTQTASDGLRAAHNGLRREQVAGIQRVRILGAMVEEAAVRGAGNVTVAQVVARSGVSRRTFYEQFDDREECFLAAFDEAVARVSPGVVEAYRGEKRWQEQIRAALIVLLGFFDGEPAIGRLLVVESLSAGASALERRRRVLGHMVAAVEEGRDRGRTNSGLPSLTGEGVVGAVLSVIHGRIVEASTGRLLDLTSPLMSMIVLPYLGPAVARTEAERPNPTPTPGTHKSTGNPLSDLGMRLTYRTIRVLMAVAEHPGASNRQVADASGIADQGQMSKLLTRLVALELVENQGPGPGPVRGEPNAWQLTTKGQEIEHAITQQTTR
jgi:AcrR family transcriptional regulator/DNA-binding MarR family transcriptional regulator